MNIVRNEKLIKRNAQIGMYTMLGTLAVLGAGIYISIADLERIVLAYVLLVVGLLLSQISFYFTNRWGRKPRPDEQLDTALKGLDGRYTIYHYSSPVDHLLVGPGGLWVLLPYYQRGVISFAKNRWQQKTKGFLLAYGKIFAQESLGRPDLEMAAALESLQRFFSKNLPEDSQPQPQVALIFTHPEAQIEIPDDVETPAEAVKLDKLKDVIRKGAKAKLLSLEKAQAIQDLLAAQIK